MATIEDFEKLDIRAGKIIEVEDFAEARKPLYIRSAHVNLRIHTSWADWPTRVYKIVIDFGGEIGKKRSAVGATHNYTKEELKGKLMLGIVNMPPRQIGLFTSEVLTLGVSDNDGNCVLIEPDRKVYLGAKLY